MTWRGAAGKKFYLKVNSGGIILGKSYATNAFLWRKILHLLFVSKILHLKVKKYVSKRWLHHQCFAN
jgi:hypothetical protein